MWGGKLHGEALRPETPMPAQLQPPQHEKLHEKHQARAELPVEEPQDTIK